MAAKKENVHCASKITPFTSTNEIFLRKKVNFEKLPLFGFQKTANEYSYQETLPESGFLMTVRISMAGEVSAKVTDPSTGEPYTLHLSERFSGRFVGGIRQNYERILSQISQNCFDMDVFKSRQTIEIIEYVRKKYGDELEFLWEKFSNNAVWRRKDSKKWYALLLTVSPKKLGLQAEEKVEIIDLRIPPKKLRSLVDGKNYFPGYHMNKKSWLTIILDGSVQNDEIYARIDESHSLAIKAAKSTSPAER